MKIVTIMENIIDENYITLCKIWLNQVKLSNPDEIIVLYNKNYPSFLDKEPLVKLVYCEYDERIEKLPIQDEKVRDLHYFFIAFKLYNLYKIKPPFIHLDVDAIPLRSIGNLWNIKTNKPLLGCGWQNFRQLKQYFLDFKLASCTKSIIGGGVLLVKDLSFMPYDELISMYKELMKEKENYLIIQDDILMSLFFRKINYDFKHEELAPKWNFSPDSIVRILNVDGLLKVLIRDDDNIIEEGAIIHYTGFSKKPWVRPCRLYNYFLKNII